jgi:hypothetical protein
MQNSAMLPEADTIERGSMAVLYWIARNLVEVFRRFLEI